MKKTEIVIVALLYTLLIISSWAGLTIHKLTKENFIAKSLAVELYKDRETHIQAVESLNQHIDVLEGQMKEQVELSRMLKDLRRVWKEQ